MFIGHLLRLLWLAPATVLAALEVNLDSPESIRNAASQVAYDLMTFYHGNETGHVPGILPGPPPDGDYYWWQGGALWGTMIDYWHFTGDETYNDVTYEAMQFQVGENWDYAPRNWTLSLGNDDQAFWGMSAMLAAENRFRDPPADRPQWLALAQAVWNEQASPDRRDDTCGGGLRWQIFPSNRGYDYKNTIANGCFFNMGARLARYTQNDTYATWAEETWDWLVGVKYIDQDYNVYDGGHVPFNCTDINPVQYSYNAAVLLLGAAYMYDYTNQSQIWEERVTGLLDGIERLFFQNGTAYEISCEGGICNTDMLSFKGYLHRWVATATQVAPFIRARVMGLLRTSAAAAAAQCTGGANGRMCGFHWTSGVFDDRVGAGQQMNVLAALSTLLINDTDAPVTNTTGGTSRGDPTAGSRGISLPHDEPPTTGDRAGAGVLTAFVLATTIGGAIWIALD
ncbi:glycoside hydrolase family 76 protein [Durotheca rogersii]|uniref:glycoside hydrolase family 76 protein n=1 Tax=Durotheca rogersii TaxID=419775 RepID=UPI00222026B0|nr:glycoside hydrolase family 76 protein [Durotheca rogersii]KAI5860830.1 glycoside hydrolase family 76 protein [Durotheca rogersii]